MRVIGYMYIFVFACLFKANATAPVPKTKAQPPVAQAQTMQQTNTKDCVKHPQIVKASIINAPKAIDKQKITTPEKLAKTNHPVRPNYNNSHYSVLNFINFFYTKDTLDNLHVM